MWRSESDYQAYSSIRTAVVIAALFLAAVFLWASARAEFTIDPPELELAASQPEAKTGDLVTITIVAGSRAIDETRVCPPPVNNTTGSCTMYRNETFVPSLGPVQIWGVRANGVRIELVPGDEVNLTLGIASLSFRVTDQFGFDVLRIEATDRFTGVVAVPIQVRLVFSEEQKYQMWRDALRQQRQSNEAVISAGEANRNYWTGFTIATFVLLDLILIGLVTHKVARSKKTLSWVDRLKLLIPLRMHADPTQYAMHEKDSWAQNIWAESQKQQILHDTKLRRRAIVEGLETLRTLVAEEKSAKDLVLRLERVILEARERLGLPATSERRGRLEALEGGS